MRSQLPLQCFHSAFPRWIIGPITEDDDQQLSRPVLMFGMATVASLTTTDALTSPACSEPAIRSTIYSAKSRSLPLRIRQARCGMPAADAGWSTHHRYSRILRSSHVTYNGRRIRNGYRCCNAEAKHCEPRARRIAETTTCWRWAESDCIAHRG